VVERRAPPSRRDPHKDYMLQRTVDVRAELQSEILKRRRANRRQIINDNRLWRQDMADAVMIAVPDIDGDL